MTDGSELGSAARADDSAAWSALMARVQDGDGLAYRRLLEEVTPYLRSLAARHRGLSGETEDTVQDILLTLHAARNSYDANRPFGPGLLAIARRRIADRLRRLGRRAAAETSLEPKHETISAPGPNLYTLLSGRRYQQNEDLQGQREVTSAAAMGHERRLRCHCRFLHSDPEAVVVQGRTSVFQEARSAAP